MPFTEIIRFLIFSGLAAIRTILEIVLWRFLVFSLEKFPKILILIQKIHLNQYSFAHAISFIASVIASYYLNFYITFADTDEQNSPALLIRFVLISVITLGISVVIINFLTSNPKILIQSKKIRLIDKHWPLISKLITIGITMIINYLGYKFYVFTV